MKQCGAGQERKGDRRWLQVSGRTWVGTGQGGPEGLGRVPVLWDACLSGTSSVSACFSSLLWAGSEERADGKILSWHQGGFGTGAKAQAPITSGSPHLHLKGVLGKPHVTYWELELAVAEKLGCLGLQRSTYVCAVSDVTLPGTSAPDTVSAVKNVAVP